MHVQASVRRVLETDKDDFEIDSKISTLEELGGYLRNLRENSRLTQASLSTKTGAMTGRTISRSRISEIENAKRDSVSERELRVYMVGLKCTPHHIDRMVKALRRCTVTSPRESPADPVRANPATLDPSLAGRGDTENDLIQRKDKSEDDPTTAGPQEEGRVPRSPKNATSDALNASQPSRRCWRRYRIPLVAATAVLVAALTVLGAKLFLRGESMDEPTSPGSFTAVLVAPHPPLSEGNPDFIKNMTSPDATLARGNESSTPTSKTKNRRDLEDTASRDTARQVVRHCCVDEEQPQVASPFSLPNTARDWHNDVDSWHSEFSGAQLIDNMMRQE